MIRQAGVPGDLPTADFLPGTSIKESGVLILVPGVSLIAPAERSSGMFCADAGLTVNAIIKKNSIETKKMKPIDRFFMFVLSFFYRMVDILVDIDI